MSGQKSAPLSVEAWSRNVAAAATRNDKIMLTAHIRALLNATLRGLAGDDGDGDVGTVRSDQQTTTQSLLTCPRCWAFLLKPVTGPCGHTLCGGCARALGTDRCDSLNRSGCCGQVVAPACPVRGCIGLGRASGSSADEFRSHEWVEDSDSDSDSEDEVDEEEEEEGEIEEEEEMDEEDDDDGRQGSGDMTDSGDDPGSEVSVGPSAGQASRSGASRSPGGHIATSSQLGRGHQSGGEGEEDGGEDGEEAGESDVRRSEVVVVDGVLGAPAGVAGLGGLRVWGRGRRAERVVRRYRSGSLTIHIHPITSVSREGMTVDGGEGAAEGDEVAVGEGQGGEGGEDVQSGESGEGDMSETGSGGSTSSGTMADEAGDDDMEASGEGGEQEACTCEVWNSSDVTLASVVAACFPTEERSLALADKGKRSLRRGHIAAARKHLANAVAENPRSHVALGCLAQAYLQPLPTRPMSPRRAGAHLAGRQGAVQAGASPGEGAQGGVAQGVDVNKAVACAQRAVELVPNWPTGYLRWGQALEAAGDRERAVSAYVRSAVAAAGALVEDEDGCGERALADAVRVAAEAVLTVGTGRGGALAGSRDGVSGGEVISGPRWQGSAAALAGVWTALRDGGRLLGQLEESEGGQRGGGVVCSAEEEGRRCVEKVGQDDGFKCQVCSRVLCSVMVKKSERGN